VGYYGNIFCELKPTVINVLLTPRVIMTRTPTGVSAAQVNPHSSEGGSASSTPPGAGARTEGEREHAAAARTYPPVFKSSSQSASKGEMGSAHAAVDRRHADRARRPLDPILTWLLAVRLPSCSLLRSSPPTIDLLALVDLVCS
jgi:hypothetical protein